MPYDSQPPTEGDEGAEIRCPACGEMIRLHATGGAPTQGGGEAPSQSWEDEFRAAMSPRTDEEPEVPE